MVRNRYSRQALLIVLLSALLALGTAACAGADGDPAPVPQEAGAIPDCTDAGAAG